MIWEYGIVKPSAHLVSGAVQGIVDDFAAGRIQDEDDFTSRMLQSIQRELNGTIVKGIVWQSIVTTSRGQNAQETATGADFMGVLNINLSDYRVRKGFLAQAKRADRLSRQEMTRLQGQCERMLQLTPESYVFLYKRDGVRVLPAISVVSVHDRDLTELYDRSVQRFFELHLESFIGDRRLSSPSADQFNALLKEYRIRHGLYLAAKQGDMRVE